MTDLGFFGGGSDTSDSEEEETVPGIIFGQTETVVDHFNDLRLFYFKSGGFYIQISWLGVVFFFSEKVFLCFFEPTPVIS
jgi:hypothetical protein